MGNHGTTWIGSGEAFGGLLTLDYSNHGQPADATRYIHATMEVEHPDRDTVTRKIPRESLVLIRNKRK